MLSVALLKTRRYTIICGIRHSLYTVNGSGARKAYAGGSPTAMARYQTVCRSRLRAPWTSLTRRVDSIATKAHASNAAKRAKSENVQVVNTVAVAALAIPRAVMTKRYPRSGLGTLQICQLRIFRMPMRTPPGDCGTGRKVAITSP